MAKIAVIKTGGKQYLVKTGDEIYIEKLPNRKGEKVALEVLAVFDSEKKEVKLGKPYLKGNVEAQVLDQLKGNKITVRRFKAKVGYRKVKGHRQLLTKIKIGQI